jgi:hypothetical protein
MNKPSDSTPNTHREVIKHEYCFKCDECTNIRIADVGRKQEVWGAMIHVPENVPCCDRCGSSDVGDAWVYEDTWEFVAEA